MRHLPCTWFQVDALWNLMPSSFYSDDHDTDGGAKRCWFLHHEGGNYLTDVEYENFTQYLEYKNLAFVGL